MPKADMNWTDSNSIRSMKLGRLESKANGRTYPIGVSLPDGYEDNPGKTYPVVYMTDAEGKLHGCTEMSRGLAMTRELPQIILVGVFNPAVGTREVDFSATPLTKSPIHAADNEYDRQGGGAPQFHQFLKEELIPVIEDNFRTDPDKRIYFGHSGGGLFGLFSYQQADDPFTDYLISAPSAWWNQKEPLQTPAQRKAKTDVYVSIGEFEQIPPGLPDAVMARFPKDLVERDNEARMVDVMLETFDYLKAQANTDVYGYIFEGMGHMTSDMAAFEQGIRVLLPCPHQTALRQRTAERPPLPW